MHSIQPPSTPRECQSARSVWMSKKIKKMKVNQSYSNIMIKNKHDIKRPYSLSPRTSRRMSEYQALKKNADSGAIEAQYMLGDWNFNGKGVMLDRTVAIKYYKLAAEQGHPMAQAKLGEIYMYGWGVQKNPEKAVYYYKLAADQLDPTSLYMYAHCLLTGTGTEINNEKAAEYFLKGCRVGNSECMYQYGLLAKEGIGVTRDLQLARDYLERADQRCHQQARAMLLNMGSRKCC